MGDDTEELTEDIDEWKEWDEVNEDSDASEVDEERDEGRESGSEPKSECESENETKWTLWVDEGTNNVSCVRAGGKTDRVGVGETTEMSHFARRVNISSASLSSCDDSRSCCASVGSRVRRFREDRSVVMRLDFDEGIGWTTAEGTGGRDPQIVVLLPSGMWTETQEGEIRSSKALPPRTEIQADHGRLAAIQAAWMARGGGMMGDKESLSVPGQEERKAVVRVDWRMSWSEAICKAE